MSAAKTKVKDEKEEKSSTVWVKPSTLSKIVELKARLTLEHGHNFTHGDAIDEAVSALLKAKE